MHVEIVPPVFEASAASTIVHYAETRGMDLIVMGTHGRRGVLRALVGSVAESVLRRAPCPVLTVRTRPDGGTLPGDLHRVLVPVDLDFFAPEAVRYGAEVAATYGATLTLLHVIDVATDPDLATLPLDAREQQLQVYEAIARERLHALAEKAAPGTPVDLQVRAGDPWAEVPAGAGQIGADLVVMPSHGLAGFQRLLMGSVAEQVMRAAQGAVFVVKPSGKSLLPRACTSGEDAACCNRPGCAARKVSLVAL